MGCEAALKPFSAEWQWNRGVRFAAQPIGDKSPRHSYLQPRTGQ